MKRWVAELFRRDRLLATVGALNFAALVVVAAIRPFDERSILGLDPWIKPMKFLASVGVYLWTLAWFLPYVRPEGGRSGLSVRAISWGISAALLFENALVVMQSARGVRSHFNFDTAFDGAVFGAMGILILINSLLVTWLLLLFFAQRTGLPSAYLWGIRLGLVFFLIGSLQGVWMITHGGHTVGGPDGGPGLPFVNWSTTLGDMRITHGLWLHGLQVLPLFGHVLTRRPGLTAGRATGFVFVLAAIWATAGVGAFVQALMERPLVAG